MLHRIYLQLFQHNGRRSSATITNTGNTSLTRLQAEKVFQVLHIPRYNSELPVHQVVDNPSATSPKGVAEAHCTAVNVNPGCCNFFVRNIVDRWQ